ncbi:VOC family protein [Gryllotalpicola reticulitermitis]|uniref:VOC family protein n=1 Tax=Gryllotalpicola reticulitermitis TaxID=1184153 RepID=A0ABV8Q4W5_9MICO
MTSIWPFLAVTDVDAAVAFYVDVFGAEESMERFRSDDGSQVAVLSIDGQPVGVATESPELRTLSPPAAGGTTVRIHLDVDDPDSVAASAVAAGAEEMFPVADQPYGVRQGRVVDPFGHHWLISGPSRSA